MVVFFVGLPLVVFIRVPPCPPWLNSLERLGVFLNQASPGEVNRLAAEINAATAERIKQLADRLNRGQHPFE